MFFLQQIWGLHALGPCVSPFGCLSEESQFMSWDDFFGNKPDSQKDQKMKKTLGAIIAASALACAAGTVTAMELDEDMVAAGKIIFEETAGGVGCASCHGMDAKGTPELGAPYIQGVTLPRIQQVLGSAVIQMLFIDLSPEEEEQVHAYLEWMWQNDI